MKMWAKEAEKITSSCDFPHMDFTWLSSGALLLLHSTNQTLNWLRRQCAVFADVVNVCKRTNNNTMPEKPSHSQTSSTKTKSIKNDVYIRNEICMSCSPSCLTRHVAGSAVLLFRCVCNSKQNLVSEDSHLLLVCQVRVRRAKVDVPHTTFHKTGPTHNFELAPSVKREKWVDSYVFADIRGWLYVGG